GSGSRSRGGGLIIEVGGSTPFRGQVGFSSARRSEVLRRRLAHRRRGACHADAAGGQVVFDGATATAYAHRKTPVIRHIRRAAKRAGAKTPERRALSRTQFRSRAGSAGSRHFSTDGMAL